jgi:hypothetical protein
LPTEPFVPDGVWVPRAILGIASRFAVPLYLELRKHCFKTPECFPGHRRLARLVGCSIGTVSALTDQFDVLGIVKKMHDGRRCHYRCAEGCWRRRKPRHASKSAHCSVQRTEERSNFVVSSDKRETHKKPAFSQRFALDAERRAKRANLIKSLRRWAALSPALPESERPHRLAMLDRAEASLDCWHARPAEDRRCFEMLVHQARGRPLEGACLQSLRQRPAGMRTIGMVLPAFRRIPAGPAASPLDMISDLSRS